MADYEKYVTEVNKIFTVLERTKNMWPNNTNLDSIEQIFSLKKEVIKGASLIQKKDVKDTEKL